MTLWKDIADLIVADVTSNVSLPAGTIVSASYLPRFSDAELNQHMRVVVTPASTTRSRLSRGTDRDAVTLLLGVMRLADDETGTVISEVIEAAEALGDRLLATLTYGTDPAFHLVDPITHDPIIATTLFNDRSVAQSILNTTWEVWR